jgi:glucose-6-phosphate dehydrogenase assembly protein OpcA
VNANDTTPLASLSTTNTWSGRDVTVAEIESRLAYLRGMTLQDEGATMQRTSVMTHVAWVPGEWFEAAERTLEGLEARHPSRTLLLVPQPDRGDGLDVELSVRCFPAGERQVCGEVIELHLRGERMRAPASIVVPLAIADLPLFLRWRGLPAFGSQQWEQLVELADRVIVDSSEWPELRYAELADQFERAAVSDIAWARLYGWRVALAQAWPAISGQEITISGPPAEASLLRGWLEARLDRSLAQPVEADELAVLLDGHPVVAAETRGGSPSDLLSAELDRSARDPIYEQAVARMLAAGPSLGA